MKKAFIFLKDKQGVALYLTMLALAILTGSVLALSGIVVSQMKTIFTAGYSVKAFFAADAGIEQALQDRQAPLLNYSGWLDLNGNSVFDLNQDASYSATSSPAGGQCTADNFCIWSQGIFRNIKRRIEVKY